MPEETKTGTAVQEAILNGLDDELEMEIPGEGDASADDTGDTDDIEVELVGEENAPPPAKEPPPLEDAPEDEKAHYSEKVKKRISQLTWRAKELERLSAQREQERQAAIQWAKHVQHQNQQLQTQLRSGQTENIEASSRQVAAELATARLELKQAHETGDAEKLAMAQEKLALAAARQGNLESLRQVMAAQAQQPQPPPEQPHQPQPPQYPVDEQAVAVVRERYARNTQQWAQKNAHWFNQDPVMTRYAIQVVHPAALSQGLPAGSLDYLAFVDEHVSAAFPGKVNPAPAPASPEQKPATPPPSVVAPAVRTANGKRKIRMSVEEDRAARKVCEEFGVPYSEFLKTYKPKVNNG